MNPFLEAFWPNLASTIAGVVLGVPIALGINKRLLDIQQRSQTTERNRQLSDAANVLMDACKYNVGLLEKIRDLALEGRVMHSPDLRLTTWDAVGGIFSKHCYKPDLLQMLSHHWLRLHRIQALTDEIFSREVTKSIPSIEDSAIALEFWQVLCNSAHELSVHATQAVEMLRLLQAELVTNSRSTSQ